MTSRSTGSVAQESRHTQPHRAAGCAKRRLQPVGTATKTQASGIMPGAAASEVTRTEAHESASKRSLFVNYSSTEFGCAKWIFTKLTEVVAWNAVFRSSWLNDLEWQHRLALTHSAKHRAARGCLKTICEESRQAQECSRVVGNSCRSTSSRSCRANDLALADRSLRWNVR